MSRPDAPAPEGWRPMQPRSAFAGLLGPFYEPVGGDGFRRGLRIAEKHANRRGIAHGGLLASFADMLLGEMISRSGNGPAVTARLSSDFISPALLGDWLEGEARLVRAGGSLVFADGRLQVGKRTVLTVSGVFARIRAGRFADPDGETQGRQA